MTLELFLSSIINIQRNIETGAKKTQPSVSRVSQQGILGDDSSAELPYPSKADCSKKPVPLELPVPFSNAAQNAQKRTNRTPPQKTDKEMKSSLYVRIQSFQMVSHPSPLHPHRQQVAAYRIQFLLKSTRRFRRSGRIGFFSRL